MNTIKLIKKCAEVPSFSTLEHRLRPVIESVVASVKNAKIERIPENNIVISVPGISGLPPVALTSHLDKIDHFGDWDEGNLPFTRKAGRIRGQLDDSTGIGICLSILALSAKGVFPRLLVLLSEMEECGEYENEEGSQLFHGIGSCRISQYLMDTRQVPGMFVTIDTSPQFRGSHGVALYSRFWEKCSLKPGDGVIAQSEAIERYLSKKFPFITVTNGSNDYINYGMLFNANHDEPVPSIAIEPAIYPCHCKGEEVHIFDIKRVLLVVTHLLVAYANNHLFENIE